MCDEAMLTLHILTFGCRTENDDLERGASASSGLGMTVCAVQRRSGRLFDASQQTRFLAVRHILARLGEDFRAEIRRCGCLL